MTQISITTRVLTRIMAVLMAALIVAGGGLPTPAVSAAPAAGDQCVSLVVKSLTGPTQASAGSVATYTLMVENPSTLPECDAGLDVSIQIGKTVPDSELAIETGPGITCNSSSLEGGATLYSVKVRCIGLSFGAGSTDTVTVGGQFRAGQQRILAEVDWLDKKRPAPASPNPNTFRLLTVNVAASSAGTGAPSAPAPAPAPAPKPQPQPQSQGSSTFPTVRMGATGEVVTSIQYLLRHRGADIVVDGDFGEQTQGAVRDFQKSKGLTVDGVVGPRTWQALIVTVKRGDQGDAVSAVQSQLTARGQDVVVDGDFGDQTHGAVRDFQKSKGLTVDGVVGPQTWAALAAPN